MSSKEGRSPDGPAYTDLPEPPYEPTGTTNEAVGPCEVCRLVRKDETDKLVRFCSLCLKWICDDCSSKWSQRGLAALITATNYVKSRLKRKADAEEG